MHWYLFLLFTVPLLLFFIWVWIHVRKQRAKKHPPFSLIRASCNPLLSPDDGEDWEAAGVFNPGVFQDEHGMHLLYRAVGGDGVSRIGYARSSDGVTIDERSGYPIFAMTTPRRSEGTKRFDPVQYPSGGSWGGCEDPRAVNIEGRIYMTFNAFDGWDYIRIGVTSIDKKDFAARRWNWSKPLLISPPGQIHKNWVLFPEKINGKFAVLHSVSPSPQIDYAQHLEELDYGASEIKSVFKQQGVRKEWDSWVRGAGPPPIKTDKGWLVLYHAINQHEGDRYKLGALLLDLHDPAKVIARAPHPLLAPDEWYENNWKPGVIYACGAVIHGDDLRIYYGGGDRYLCTAHAPLHALLEWLLRYGRV